MTRTIKMTDFEMTRDMVGTTTTPTYGDIRTTTHTKLKEFEEYLMLELKEKERMESNHSAEYADQPISLLNEFTKDP
mgnify:CR=1 FL=1